MQITCLQVHDFWNQTISFRHVQVTNASPSRIAFQLRRASLEIEAIAVKDCEPLVFLKGLVMPTKHGERDGPQYDPYTWQQQMLGVVLREAKSTYITAKLLIVAKGLATSYLVHVTVVKARSIKCMALSCVEKKGTWWLGSWQDFKCQSWDILVTGFMVLYLFWSESIYTLLLSQFVKEQKPEIGQ